MIYKCKEVRLTHKNNNKKVQALVRTDEVNCTSDKNGFWNIIFLEKNINTLIKTYFKYLRKMIDR